MWKDRLIAVWTCGFILGALMVVVDELITQSLYCGRYCDYPIPFIGPLTIYNAWTLVFASIFATIFVTLLIIHSDKT